MACIHGGCDGNHEHSGGDRAGEPRCTKEVTPAKCCGGRGADEATAREPSPSPPD